MKKLIASVLVGAMLATSMTTVAFAAGKSVPLEIEGDFSGETWGFIVGSYEHVFYQKVDEGIRLGCEEIGIENFEITDCTLKLTKLSTQSRTSQLTKLQQSLLLVTMLQDAFLESTKHPLTA